MSETPDAAPPEPRRTRTRAVLGRIVGLAILIAAVGLAIYVVYYLDHSPRTDDAFVRADTIGVAPQVSGRIVSLRVRDNQAVKAQAHQAADTLNRIEPLLAKEYVTAEQVDQARTAKRTAAAALEVARRDAERAVAGVTGVDALVAKLGELQAAVAVAELDLEHTVVRAPFDGRVVNLDIAEGEFAATGRPLFTLIDTRNWYVIANFRETMLKRIEPGMTAEVFILADPRRRFAGTVQSIGYGVFP